MPGDTGHLTYGRAQTTLASGNLYLLLKAPAMRGDDVAEVQKLLTAAGHETKPDGVAPPAEDGE